MSDLSPSDDDFAFIASLREVKVFVTDESVLGIPTKLAYFGALFILYLAFFFSIGLAFVISLIYFPTMYLIHKADRDAAILWASILRQPDAYISTHDNILKEIMILED